MADVSDDRNSTPEHTGMDTAMLVKVFGSQSLITSRVACKNISLCSLNSKPRPAYTVSSNAK